MHHPVETVTFPAQPDVLDLGHRQKELHSPYQVKWEQEGRLIRLKVPAGFVYNGASVPSFVWSFYPPHALDRAAVFHDFIYRDRGVMPSGAHQYFASETGRWRDIEGVWSRSAADALFERHLAADPRGPGRIRRKLAVAAVRAFGGSYWGP